MIEVKYFGAVAEKTKCDKEMIPFSGMSLTQLIINLREKYNLESLTYSVAVNQKINSSCNDYELKPNDIIALLPPFAGG